MLDKRIVSPPVSVFSHAVMHNSQGMGLARPAGIGPYAEQNSPLRPRKVRRCPLLEHKAR